MLLHTNFKIDVSIGCAAVGVEVENVATSHRFSLELLGIPEDAGVPLLGLIV